MVVINQVLSFVQFSLAIDKVEVQVILEVTNWMTLIVSYLRNRTLLENCNASHRLKVQSKVQEGLFLSISEMLSPCRSRLHHKRSP